MNSPDDASPVVVGTIAFGMGLDKKNVRRVFHFNVPKSPEDLAQQVIMTLCHYAACKTKSTTKPIASIDR